MKSINNWKISTRWLLVTLLVVILVLGGTAGYYIHKLNSTIEVMYQPVKREETKKDEIPRATGVKTYLILGTDQRPGDGGRTDGIIIAIVNDHKRKITLTSIPRDTYVGIAGLGRKDKINAAYSYKGISGSIATVENFLDIPFDHYIWFNMQGFIKAVDTVGGIELNVDKGPAKAYKLPEGLQLLNGEQALKFTRFRYDINGDFGRNDRQQEALKAFLDRSKNVRSPIKINNLLEVLGEDVRMDLDKNQLYSLAKQLNDYSSKDVEQIKFKATTGPINGISYVFVSEEERTRVASVLKERLNQ